MISDALYSRFYGYRGNPEYDGTLAFYSLLRRYAQADHHVLNIGAGPASSRKTGSLKGEVARVVGADIDPVVLTNDQLDDAVVIENDKLPFPEESFDLAYGDYVFEHVERPLPFLREIHRVLKPGARFLFRTPNVFHYVTLISLVTPHWFHKLVANRLRALSANEHEPWPTYYRLNSRAAIKRQAGQAGFKGVDLRMVEAEPSYLMFHALPFMLGVAYERAVNSSEILGGLRANIFGQLVK